MDPLSEIRDFIQQKLSDHLGLTSENIKVIRRNRTLLQGDFQIPVACLKAVRCVGSVPKSDCQHGLSQPVDVGDEPPTACKTNVGNQSLTSDEEKQRVLSSSQALEESIKSCCWDTEDGHQASWFRVRQCNVGKDNNVYIHLRREEVFSHVLTRPADVLPPKDDSTDTNIRVLLNCASAYDRDNGRMRVDDLRALLLQEHIQQLLLSNRFSCLSCPRSLPKEWEEICSIFGLPHSQDAHRVTPTFMESLHHSKYRVTDPEESQRGSSSSSLKDVYEKQKITFDLGQFIVDKNLRRGKEGFDKNVKYVSLTERNILDQVGQLEACVSAQEKIPDVCLHLVSRAGSFLQQQLHLLWQIAVEDQHEKPRQLHVVYGGVSQTSPTANKDAVFVDHYFRIRKLQMERAFLLKYGDRVQGTGWNDTITQLTTAAIRIELLTNSCNSQVKIDMRGPADGETEGGDQAQSGANIGVGVFVMYNYARLANLLDNFDKAVQDGVYPPLPDVREIQFQTLREDEEWGLLFNYIIPYRSMINDSAKDLLSSSLKANIHTHKLCQYLHDLSRDLSSYYSRTHVLVECRHHLVPVVHARVCLLRGVYHILRHALGLLGISPLSQL